MRTTATALLVALIVPASALAVDPAREGGATLPPSGGATAPEPAEPEAEPSFPPLVPVEPVADPAGGVEAEPPAPGAPEARAAQDDDGYTEVQVPMPQAEGVPDATGSATVGDGGLASTGLELSLVVAAGMSMLGAGLLVLGLVRRPR